MDVWSARRAEQRPGHDRTDWTTLLEPPHFEYAGFPQIVARGHLFTQLQMAGCLLRGRPLFVQMTFFWKESMVRVLCLIITHFEWNLNLKLNKNERDGKMYFIACYGE